MSSIRQLTLSICTHVPSQFGLETVQSVAMHDRPQQNAEDDHQSIHIEVFSRVILMAWASHMRHTAIRLPLPTLLLGLFFREIGLRSALIELG